MILSRKHKYSVGNIRCAFASTTCSNLEQFVTRMEEFPCLQIQAIYERSLNFKVLALKQIGLVYFIPGHRSGLFKIFWFVYHTY